MEDPPDLNLFQITLSHFLKKVLYFIQL